MDSAAALFKLLETVTVDCKDDGEKFTVTDRLSVIETLLADSPYEPLAREPLALLYARRKPSNGDSVVLLSSHIDTVYSAHFCTDEGDCLRGTFDNSFGNAAALWCMLNNLLPDNVVVAFTGDEEQGSQGAREALAALEGMGVGVSAVIVQDVTNVGWNSGALFTVENDFGFDIFTAYSIVSELEPYSGRFAFCHNAEPDESWLYAEYALPCLTLCVPVGGELHSDRGVQLRKMAALEYCNALSILARVLC